MTIITRFAPSPTGTMHIGNARTAFYNWLYTRHVGGKFLLRIEDTDRDRSTPEAVKTILNGLAWLGIDYDSEPVFQFACRDRHAAVAHELIAKGKAYKCYLTPEELDVLKAEARANGVPVLSPWRDKPASDAPVGQPFSVRLKAPRTGKTSVTDMVQGLVEVDNKQLDDMVLLRSDGTPTYMLSVVVDDFDMHITHVIRGDDHLNNTFRQIHLFQAMDWPVPTFGHLPLLHGADGAKLSKRHGAVGVEEFRSMGILPEAMQNYLLRLGWSHGDQEIFTTSEAISLFDFANVGKSASRFEMDKLVALNGHYIRHSDNAALLDMCAPLFEEALEQPLNSTHKTQLLALMDGLKERAKTLHDIIGLGVFVAKPRPLVLSEGAAQLLTPEAKETLQGLVSVFEGIADFTHDGLDTAIREWAKGANLKLGDVLKPLRACITGEATSPPMMLVLEVLGKTEVIARIKDQI